MTLNEGGCGFPIDEDVKMQKKLKSYQLTNTAKLKELQLQARKDGHTEKFQQMTEELLKRD